MNYKNNFCKVPLQHYCRLDRHRHDIAIRDYTIETTHNKYALAEQYKDKRKWKEFVAYIEEEIILI